jgi:hypothetical protein
MDFHLDNLGILFGLFALAIPIVLHLLQRRHFDTLDWGAMQFLPDSVATQRRRWLDELLLLLMRMAMVALIVLALASPFSTSTWLAPLGDDATRDVVIVIDGSYSMDLRLPNQPTPWHEAIRAANGILDNAGLGDRFALVVAKQTPLFGQLEFSSDSDTLREQLAKLPTPRDNPDMPQALAQTWRLLQTRSKATVKEIIVLTDRQKHGWADLETLAALDALGGQWHADVEQAKSDGLAVPSLRVVLVGTDLPTALPNYALSPVSSRQGVAKLGQKIMFQTALHLDQFLEYAAPRAIKVVVDGKVAQSLPVPASIDLKRGQIPLRFEHRFDKEGTHTIAVTLNVDPALDVLPGDNEQQTVIEIVKEMPILVVDGDRQLSSESSSFFAQRALATKQAVPYPALKSTDVSKAAVIVLADVPLLDTPQIDAIDRFLAEGGGLFIAVGERVAREKSFYNEQLYRQGQGWLPAKLLDVGSAKGGVLPEPSTFQHPALELFRSATDSTLGHVRFSHWWRTKPAAPATALAMLSNGDPLLIEKSHKGGRVILCTAPLDRRWDSTLPNTWEFPILMHELAYYLAGSRSAAGTPPLDLRESNLARCSDDDCRKVRERLPVRWHSEPMSSGSTSVSDATRQDLWWLLMLAVVGFLCLEVWMTRRLALARGR